MIAKKFLAFFTLLAVLVVWIPIAKSEEHTEEVGYIDLKAGDISPTDGLLFDPAAIAKLIAKQESKLALCKIESETTVKKLEIEWDTKLKKKDIELAISKELNESLLKIKQDRIEQLLQEQRWENLKLISSFIIGFAASVSIYYAAVQVAK